MKFINAIVLLSIPSVVHGFTVQPISILSRAKPLKMGFVSDWLSDRFDNEEKERKAITDRVKNPVITQARKAGASLIESTEKEEQVYWEVKDDGIFGFVPTKEMTGVEPHMTQLCSTLSSQLYRKTKFEDFKLSTKDNKAELLIYDDHGKLKEATPPFGAVVSGDTLILGWRGTSGISDLMSDAAASPQSNFAWRKHAKTIKVQAPMTSIVQNDLVTHEEELIKEIKARGIKEIVTTGQSLGGGCAQAAHLTLRAQMQDETSPWYEVGEVENVRSVGFCAPMTVTLLNNASPETDKFVKDVNDNSCNMIFSNDVVPRGYGYLSFVEDFVDNATGDLAKNMIPLPGIMKGILDVKGRLENLVDEASNNEQLQAYLGFMSNYRHLGNQIYYETEDSKPRVLKDMGAFYKNSRGDKDILRDVRYKPVENPIEEFMDWHMRIIHGPGLSYPEDQLS